MSIVLVRVDSRLIHGQILEAWIPHIGAEALLVVDDEVVKNILKRSVMEMAVPSCISVNFDTIDEFVKEYMNGGFRDKRTLILFSDVKDVKRAHDKGFIFNTLNLGNMHYCEGKVQVCSNLCLGNDDLECLKGLKDSGVSIDSRSVPGEKNLEFDRLIKAIPAKGG